MAKSKPAPEAQPAPGEEAPAPRKSRLPKLLVLSVVLLAQVALAYFIQRTFFFKSSPLTAGDAVVAAAPAPKEEEPEAELQVITLDEIVVNPAETGGRRYLAVTIGLQMAGEESQQVVDKNAPVIRDALISLLSAKHLEQLADIAYRDSLKLEIKDAVNGRLKEKPVKGVVFSGYVLQ